MGNAQLPIARPLLGELEAQAAGRAVRSGWVTQGPETEAFEHEFAQAVGARYACAVSSCTAALHLALLSLEVTAGDEVIVPTHSFVATANAVRVVGATPVFVDIDPTTYNLDPDRVSAAVTERTRAILCVHQMGLPSDLNRLLGIADRSKIPLVEDAACAIGSEYRHHGQWERIGRPRGAIACFSFHPRKLVTAGEGGMLTTCDEALDSRFRRLRHQGMTISDATRHHASRVQIEQYSEVGFNYRMTDIQAAVGREQLKRLACMVERRRRLADRYGQLLASTSVVPPCEPPWARSNWQSYCVRLPAGADQQTVMQHMLDRGVATRPGIVCAHREPAYRDSPWMEGPGGLAHSEKARGQCVLLPLFHQLTDEDQVRVVRRLVEAISRA